MNSNNKLPKVFCYQIFVEEVLIVDGSFFQVMATGMSDSQTRRRFLSFQAQNFKVAGSVSLELSFRPSPVLLAPVPVKIRSQYYGGTVDLFTYK